MHVVSKHPFNEAARAHPNHRQALEDLHRVLRESEFSSPDEMRRIFPALDKFKFKDKWWVIDVAGDHLRVVAFIQFVLKRMYVKYILTHADYDKLCKRYARGDLK